MLQIKAGMSTSVIFSSEREITSHGYNEISQSGINESSHQRA